ncbi:MAG: hypothetical protein AB7S49_12015 [Arcobacter sp.]|uniref:TonB C-terminal domain-containing protein n=1 Tax=Arcobacter defluvii TaxID=873191 RepID=A0AAE7BDH2_9BACT|nr:hypothetical protein [Arcobacter defluvii]QKF77098.1 hypothetical protein ADFLV_1064 [Arcobacter defluvii]RXI33609.1 hypothetical protein CP964_06340 [Arcobacter defluvii]
MTTKTKTFFEDLFVLLVLGIIIYAIYSFVFSDEEKDEFVENKPVIEKSVENDNFSKPIVDEIKDEELEKKVEETITETQKEPSTTLIEPTPTDNDKTTNDVERTENKPIIDEIKKEEPIITTEKIIENKPNVDELSEKPLQKEEQILDEKAKIEAFYQTIREKIYSNIEKNIDKTSLKNKESVNIRVTILKDGRYEQLTFMGGNKENYELIKNSIYNSFPVMMDESIKNNFPRYFRMKIEF